jgi:formate dehydrogenase major subunit
VLACPAQTDCQGYVGLIANGEYGEALQLVKDKIPLPGSIGRVCPHPCEEACRRQKVEEPISIAALKRFVADRDMASGELIVAETAADTGKTVAIIGGGPGGLTAAYFLRVAGHAVTVFDAMPEMGGMLQYGIPEYRLPKKYLQAEIAAIREMGVAFRNNVKIGRDVTFESLRESFDAVIVAVGAWTSTGLRCPGEELEGVIGGIDFLREIALGKPLYTGKRVAVVGGGNTAMDACRTAVRLGAEKVYNIYRRTKNEMPAEEIEIQEAEEEGVIFKNLTNPLEVIGENGRVSKLLLQIMELGEPDASGRRAPVPVPGKEEILEVDTVIVAIGQKPNPAGLAGLELTKWGTIAADERSFRVSLPGVFAIGDATNKGADIAIAAIGEAKKAAAVVDSYLFGEDAAYKAPFLVESDPAAEEFAAYEKSPRAIIPCRAPAERRRDFGEVTPGLSEEEARREATRCLECGCHDYFECKLIEYANQYTVAPQRLAGQVHHREIRQDHPFIRRNPDKCILCGLCVRICDEVVGATALGLVDRGFDTIVKPALDLRLQDTDCLSCGQCVAVCPTGALTETMQVAKQVPTRELCTETICSFCSVGCKTKLTHKGDLLLRALPVAQREADALLCMKGRFGFGEISKLDRLTMPLARREGKLTQIPFDDAYVLAAKKLQAIQTRYGKDSIAFAVSDRYTSEEIALIREYATAFETDNLYSFSRPESGLADVLGADVSTAGFEELTNTSLILLVGVDIQKPHLVAGIRVRRAAERGAKVIALNGFDSAVDALATMKLDPGDDLTLLREILAAMLELAPAAAKLPGYEALAASLSGVTPGDNAKAVAVAYTKAKKAVILFEEASLSADAARLLGNIALVAGHASAPRSGILRLKAGANGQGLADLGVQPGHQLLEKLADGRVRGLFLFGEDVAALPRENLEFLAVQDLQLTATAAQADLVLPAQSFAELTGSFVNAVGNTQRLRAALPACLPHTNLEMLCGLSAAAGRPLAYCSLEDVPLPTRPTLSPQLIPAPQNGKFAGDKHASTNALYTSLMAFAANNGL